MYGLVRIVLHNSYVQGKTTYIPCRGHTNNSGDNGVGKTSALRLIPIFYGKEPESLVDTSGGKKSFLDYYLPTLNSLVVFEYEREDGINCAALYRHPTTPKKLCYRFIKSGFDSSFFEGDTYEKMMSNASIADVVKDIRQKGVQVSNLISTVTAFRSIIQQDEQTIRRNTQDRGQLRKDAFDFCLGTSQSKMSDIHELTSSLLNRDKMLPRLKQMIAHTKLGDFGSIEKPVHLQNEALLDDISSMRVFGKYEADILDCIDRADQYNAVAEVIDLTARTLSVSIEEHEQEYQTQTTLIAELEEALRQKARVYEEQHQVLQNEFSGKKADLDALDKRLGVIYDKKDSWEQDGIEDKASQFENLAVYVDAAERSNEQFQSLTAQIQHVELERQTELNTVETQYRASIQPLLDRKSSLEQEKETVKSEGEDRISSIREEKTRVISDLKDQLNSEEIEIQVEVTSIESDVRNVRPLESDEVALTSADQKIEYHEAQKEKVSEKLEKAKETYDLTKAKRDKAVEFMSSLQTELDTKNTQRDSYLKQRFPEGQSFLAELKRSDTGWVNTVGKVIKPELLHSKSLSPELIAEVTDDTFYGWKIDLDQLDQPEEALSEEALDEKIQKIETEISSLGKQIGQEGRSIQRINTELEENRSNIASLNSALQGVKNDIVLAKNHKGELKKSIAASVAARKLDLSEKLALVTARLKRFTESRQKKIDALVDSYGQKIIDARALLDTELSNLQQKIEAQDELCKKLEEQKKQSIALVDKKFDQKAVEEGIDPSVRKQAREARDKAAEKVKEVKGFGIQVQAYQTWLKSEWAQVSNLTLQESDLKVSVGVLREKIADLESKYNEEKLEVTNARDQLSSKHQKLKGKLNSSKVTLSCVPYNAVGDLLEDRDLDLLAEKLKVTVSDSTKLSNDVSNKVRKVTSVFTKYSRSQVADAWGNLERARINITSHEEGSREFEIEQAQDLRSLHNDFMPQIRATLLENVRSFGQSLCNYYLNLKEISSRIARISNELGAAINTNQRIGSISDVTILLESRVETFECWPYLSNFNNDWAEWRNSSGQADLPPEHLVESLRSANQSLNEARIKDDKASLINLKIGMVENGNSRTIGTDTDFNNSSSNGLSYLAICIVFMGITRYLCPDKRVQLAWPIDELAALSPNNIASLFVMMNEQNIVMFSAFPSEDPSLLKHFESKNLLALSGVRKINLKKAKANVAEIRARNKQIKAAQQQVEEEIV